MQKKHIDTVKMTSSKVICIQMLSAVMNATIRHGLNPCPIEWHEQDIKFTKYFADNDGNEKDPEESVIERNRPHSESLKMQFSAHGLWYTGNVGNWNDGRTPVDISGEVRIFRLQKGLAWQVHYCTFMQPSLGQTKIAHSYIFHNFVDSEANVKFLSARKFSGRNNWADEIDLINDSRKEEFFQRIKPWFVVTKAE